MIDSIGICSDCCTYAPRGWEPVFDGDTVVLYNRHNCN